MALREVYVGQRSKGFELTFVTFKMIVNLYICRNAAMFLFAHFWFKVHS